MKRGELAMAAAIRSCVLALGLAAVASPAAAQWTRVVDLPVTQVFGLFANGDTIAAGTDTSVFVSTDAGTSWHHSPKPAAGVGAIPAVLFRNGRLFAGTFGQGAFFSDNLGATWQAFNQGLVGGFANSQLDLSDFQVLGDSLYAATAGAGVYVRGLIPGGTWSHFGDVFEPSQASNVNAIGVGGARLLAAAGSNGTVFVRDPGASDWTESSLANGPLLPGLQAQSVAFTGSGWIVGSARGLHRSLHGQEPWSFTDPGLGPLTWTAFATRDQHLFVAFSFVNVVNTVEIEHSEDDGATLHELDFQPNAFVFRLALSGTELYAARADGLWRRATADVSVSGDGAPRALRFALAGPQPVGDVVRFRFELPESGNTSIDVFDLAGRRAMNPIRQSWSAGAHEVSWNARGLDPGVYEARLTAGARHAVVRLVHIR